MKRLYYLGTTADNKRLVLANRSGAKFGSFVVPITPRLKKLFREMDEGRAETEKAPAGEVEGQPAEGTEGSFEAMTGLGEAARASKRAAKGRGRAKAAPAPQPPPEPEPPPRPVERRPPINSKLAPAQIQAMLRTGKSANSVAKAAGAPIEWVRRLMEPILLERMGIVDEMKRATFTKARRGPSVVPVGASIVDNLRDRGVSFPERAATRGWTAHRPDGREWRVRFTYEHRGGSRTAQWKYDPPTRSVVPMNTLATQLSWRPGHNETGGDAGEAGDSGQRARQMPRRQPAKRTATKRAGAARRGAKPSARKKPVAKKAASRTRAARRR